MIRALLSIGLLQFVSMLLLLARTKIIALALGPEGVGAIATVDRVTAVIAQTLSLSLPFAALRFLPAVERESPDEAEALYRRMRNVAVVLTVAASLVCAAIAAAAPGLWGTALVPYRAALILAFAALPVIGLVPFLTNAFAATTGHLSSMRFTLAHGVVFVLAAATAASGFGVAGFYGAYALLGTALVVAAVAKLRVPGATKVPPARSLTRAFKLPRNVWRFSVWLFPLTFAAPYAAFYVQYSTLRLYGASTAGILVGAIGIGLSVRTLLGASHSIFLTPNLNRQANVVERMAWANDFQRHIILIFIAAVPPVLLFSDVELAVLYSPRFVAAAPFVALFVAAEVVTLLSGYQGLLLAENRVRYHVFQNIVAQVLMMVIAAIAIPHIGIAGAGLAMLSAPVFLFVSTLWYLRRQFGVRPSLEAAHMGWLTVSVLVVCGGFGSLFPGITVERIGAKLAACIVVWIAAYALMPSEDRARLRVTLNSIRSRGLAALLRRGRLV